MTNRADSPQRTPEARAARRERAKRRSVIRRRRAVAGTVVLGVTAVIAVILATGGGKHPRLSDARGARTPTRAGPTPARPSHPARRKPSPPARPPVPHPPFAVGSIVLRLTDRSRTVSLPGGSTGPRTLVTIVRYPALGRPGGGDRLGAPPARAAAPFPLIIFGHGFAVTPGIYASLLRAWASAGYVVAAPVFPLGNANAPGGPNESDLPNQPGDMKFVIGQLVAASARGSGRLAGLINPRRVAVSGQSDGGDTALAVSYDPRYRDPRIDAAVILSGAEIPFISSFQIAPGGPPLLATQGTADTINPPAMTRAFYDGAPPPKYLLWLLGAQHLPPYTAGQPQLGIVERVTIAFLDRYLKGAKAGIARMESAGNVGGVATLDAHP